MTAIRRLIFTIGALAAAIAVTASLASASLAGGATRARAIFVDVTGAEVGWASLVEDGQGLST